MNHLHIKEQIRILYEDDWLLAVDKPSGLPTQNTLDPKRESMYQFLLVSKKWNYLGLHHRIDSPTSGIVLLTKSKLANKGVGDLFKLHQIQKKYLCLTQKVPLKTDFEVENHLKVIKLSKGKIKVRSTNSGGDWAHTLFKVIDHFGERASLIEAYPQTGRMHQIRVHLSELGHPILGDALYFRVDRHFPRLLLHASEIQFIHPITNQSISITSPIPEDFNRAIEYLKRKGELSAR